jgi:hypothetical protein
LAQRHTPWAVVSRPSACSVLRHGHVPRPCATFWISRMDAMASPSSEMCDVRQVDRQGWAHAKERTRLHGHLEPQCPQSGAPERAVLGCPFKLFLCGVDGLSVMSQVLCGVKGGSIGCLITATLMAEYLRMDSHNRYRGWGKAPPGGSSGQIDLRGIVASGCVNPCEDIPP